MTTTRRRVMTSVTCKKREQFDVIVVITEFVRLLKIVTLSRQMSRVPRFESNDIQYISVCLLQQSLTSYQNLLPNLLYYVYISSHPLTCMSLYDISVNVKPSALFPPPGPEVEGVCKYGGVGLPTLLSCLSSGCLV